MDAIVANNILSDPGDSGIVLGNVTTGDTGVLRRVRVVGNIVTNATNATNATNDGIQADSLRDVTLRGNILTGVRHGIRITGGRGITIDHNEIRQATGRGFDTTGSMPITDIRARWNLIDGTGNVGIITGSNVTEARLIGNDARNTTSSGIYIDGTAATNGNTLTMVDNSVVGAGTTGIRLPASSKPRRWAGNTAQGANRNFDNAPVLLAFTAPNTETINSGDATTDAVITNLRDRVAELEALLAAAKWVTG